MLMLALYLCDILKVRIKVVVWGKCISSINISNYRGSQTFLHFNFPPVQNVEMRNVNITSETPSAASAPGALETCFMFARLQAGSPDVPKRIKK